MKLMLKYRSRRFAFLSLSLLAGTGAAAVPPKPGPTLPTEAQERAACQDGSSGQERSSCLREVAAARAEARRGVLDTGESPAALRANALQRCQRFGAEDKPACEALARHEGEVSGTVRGGGQLRQITVRQTAPPSPAAASSAKPP